MAELSERAAGSGRPAAVWLVSIGVAAAVSVGLAGCVYYLKPQCTDEIRNGSESDVDCGGSCRQCVVGRSCDSGTDCESGTCVSGSCAPRPCENRVRDGAETDVDCGGGTCRKCSGGRHCLIDGDCFGGTCDTATNSCSSLRNVSFADAVSYFSGEKTYALFSGDLDGDGHVDLAAANEQGDSVSVFLGRGDGTFQLVGEFPTGAYPTGGAIADLNRDGVPDIVTANWHGNSVSVLFGVGDGTLRPPIDYPAAAETQNLAVGDLNGDGYPDVIAANLAASSVSLFKGRSDGMLDPAIDIPVGIRGASAPSSVAIGDFNGDGNDDVAVAEGTSRKTIVRLGKGDGSFGPEVAYAGTGYLVTFDIDLDGTLDLVFAGSQESVVGVLSGRGDGTFRDAVFSTTGPGTEPFSLAIGDLNLDGVPDVVTANFKGVTASVLLGVGDGSFEPPVSGGVTGPFTYGVAIADINSDGKPDFATCNAATNDVKVTLNTSN